jgi:hypothetical protein
MSSFFIIGFMAVKDGHLKEVDTSSNSGGTIRLHYVYYTVGLQCLHPQSNLLGELRSYCHSSTDPILPDNTVIFVVAKAHAPPNACVVMDSLYIAAIPGNPEDESYDDHVPDMCYPFVFCLGQVTRSLSATATSTLKTFQLNVSEYVRSKQNTSSLQCAFHIIYNFISLIFALKRCVFDSSHRRWARTPLPKPNTIVEVYGICRSITPAGNLEIQVENLALNIGVTRSSPSSPFSISDTDNSPMKRRKFNVNFGQSVMCVPMLWFFMHIYLTGWFVASSPLQTPSSGSSSFVLFQI